MARRRGRSNPLSRAVGCLVRGLCWFPVVFVVCFMLWCYYVCVFVVMIFQGPGLPDKPIAVRVLLLVVGHVILALQLATYVRAIVCTHKPMPPQFKLPTRTLESMAQEGVDEQSILKDVARSLPVHTLSQDGGVRWCHHCECIKPDRCHHCSTCGKCVLKMDHHCPWVNNCVGYYNYKFFLLFLFYTVLLCVYVNLSTVYDFYHIWKNIAMASSNSTAVEDQFPVYWARFNTLFLFFLVICFAVAVSCLLLFHVYLVCNNKTTIENMEPPRFPDGPDNKMYDLGCRSNLRQVFGSNILLALLPMFTSEGDGVDFPMGRGEGDRQEAWSGSSRGRDQPQEDDPDSEPSESEPLRQHGM